MSESSQSRFSDVETHELGEYEPLSGTAIAALVASVVGIIAAFQPWLYAIPVFAAILSAVAMAISSRSKSRGGKSLATCALLLSLFLVGFALARSFSREQHLYDLARPHAETWLRLILEGRVKEAHQLTLEESLRDKGDLDYVYSIGEQEAAAAMRALQSPDGLAPSMEAMASSPKPRRDEIQRFLATPDVEKLTKLNREATLSFVRGELISDSWMNSTIAETFAVAGGSGQEPFEVTLVLKRTNLGDHAGWHVSMQ